MFLDPEHPRHQGRRARFPTALALLLTLCALAAACGDQTEQANKLVAEMNNLVVRGEGMARQGTAKQEELEAKDIEKERDAVRAGAREQATLFKQAADAFREAAAKADEAAKLRLADWYKNYLSLKAQQHRKTAELLDAALERAELLAGDQPLEELDAKLSQSAERVARLSKEEEELVKQVKRVEEEHKADFTP
ncbi:MAG TPA: hypothetical protein VF064_07265 [Pyrinomonadaceae bacterium]